MTAKEKLETGIQRAVKLEAVPAERFSVMLQRTVLGVLLVGLGVYLCVDSEGMTLYIGVALVLLGAHIWSGQVINNSLTAIVDLLGKIVRPSA